MRKSSLHSSATETLTILNLKPLSMRRAFLCCTCFSFLFYILSIKEIGNISPMFLYVIATLVEVWVKQRGNTHTAGSCSHFHSNFHSCFHSCLYNCSPYSYTNMSGSQSGSENMSPYVHKCINNIIDHNLNFVYGMYIATTLAKT